MKVKPYQFDLATISGFRDHSHMTWCHTNQNQLVNIYLIDYRDVFDKTQQHQHWTLEYEISIQVVINVQVGIQLNKNKHTGLNKCTGWNLETRSRICLAFYRSFCSKGELSYVHLHKKWQATAIFK